MTDEGPDFHCGGGLKELEFLFLLNVESFKTKWNVARNTDGIPAFQDRSRVTVCSAAYMSNEQR